MDRSATPCPLCLCVFLSLFGTRIPRLHTDLLSVIADGFSSFSGSELDLSVRAHNCLKAANIKNIGDLVRRDEPEMLKFRNFGRKSLQELMQVLEERGLHFGMDVDKYLQD